MLVRFPNSNLTDNKLRPALIVQADNLRTGLAQLVVAMISTKVVRANHPSRILIRAASPSGRQAGVLKDSVVMTDNLTTVVTKAVYRRLGQLPMKDVEAALRHTLSL